MSMHPDALEASALLERLGLACSEPVEEPDNAEYGAFVCEVEGRLVRFRVGKVTPKKVGLFVTVWRRAPGGSTEPFASEDGIGALVVAVREGSRFGCFVFPNDALAANGIVSVGGQGGKRGFRVYPPWSETANAQAKQTQRWQDEFFLSPEEEKRASEGPESWRVLLR